MVLQRAIGDRITSADAEGLSADQLRHAREALEDFFRNWTAPFPRGKDELRVSVGEQYLGRNRGRLIGDLALYAHTVVVRDPLERWLDERDGLEDSASGSMLAAGLQSLEEIQELVDSRVVLPAPFASRNRWANHGSRGDYSREIEEATYSEMVKEATADLGFAERVLGKLPIRADHWPLVLWEEDPDDPDRDLSLMADLPDPASDVALNGALMEVKVEASLKIDRLLHAYNAGAIFTPLSRNDQAFVDAALPGLIDTPSSPAREIEAEVISTLTEIRVPALSGLSPANLVAARREADGFEEWRAYLRDLLNKTRAATNADTGKMEYLVNDELKRAAAEVRAEVSRSRVLREATRESGSRVAVSSLIWLGGAAGFGLDPRTALLGGGVNALAAILAGTFMRKGPAGYRGVLLQLIS